MIHNMVDKIKSYEKEIFVAITSVLGVILAVGGVLLWTSRLDKAPIEYRKNAFDIEFAPPSSALFVASKNGSKYYPIDCKSANRINDENKIFFESESEATDSGFERTSSCR
ncbi:MAG: hypothetical protein O2794_04385 [bacterium]|nr:hypothetical protein [bacterium]